MNRLTRLEIQRALLGGELVTWSDTAGRPATLRLVDAPQRRLFAFLLTSDVRDPRGLPENFIKGLATAFAAADDPASDAAGVASDATPAGPWKLQAIETEGFGGLNTCSGPAFVLQLDAKSLLLQGPNGSGKSSLIGAVLWAMTGERPRDHSDARPEARADVFNEKNRAVGNWPPIACYPDDPAKLSADPHVRVTLTFVDPAGATATVERVLKDGVVRQMRDPAFEVPDIFVETGLLMPSRMPQIRFQKGQTRLTDAVQSLTGLDDLIAIGLLVNGLCHKGREYLATNAKELSGHKDLFDAALAETRRILAPTGLPMPAFEPKDTQDKEGPMAAFGKQLSQRAAELTRVITDDLVAGLDLTSASVQQDVAGAISGALEDLGGGLTALPSWKELSVIESAVTPAVARGIASAVVTAEQELAEALDLDRRSATDTRLQLKALGAHWHEDHRGGSVSQCPLCDNALNDRPDLANELEALRKSGEAASRLLNDNLNAIYSKLHRAIPAALTRTLSDVQGLAPQQRLIEDLEARFVTRERYSRYLATFAKLVGEALAGAPAHELAADVIEEPGVDEGGAAQALRSRIASVRRLPKLAAWFREEADGWRSWWDTVSDPATRRTEEPAPAGTDLEPTNGVQPTEPPRVTLSEHLDRLSAAIGEAEPYRLAAEALGRAWKSGRQAWGFEKEQKQRDAIVESLGPLKTLGALAESQAHQAIEELSEEIGVILKRIQISERLTFQGAKLERKDGLVVRAGFEGNLKVDATLVANTSWLRAVLWAFLFALRKEARQQLTADSFPVLLLDDPQATFDAEHRHRWTREIISLQQEGAQAQILLTTHDEAFLELVKIDGVVGREAIITSAGPELGHVGIFEGASLDRKWAETQKSNTPQAGRDYMNAVRIYVEGMLQLMLRGESADVSAVGSGFVLGNSRDKLEQLNKANIAPWNKPEFSSLAGQLGKGLQPIKHIEIAHHASGAHLGMGEATNVELHWRKKLQPAVDRAFRLAREHQLLHGGLKALQATEPTCALPEGYRSKVGDIRLKMLGKAAALSNGRAADGRVELTIGAPSETIVLGRHFAYRLAAATMEPVARRGDVLLVQEPGEPSSRSLVVAKCADRVLARRFLVSENHSDVAVLTAQAINPRQIFAPIVVKRATLALYKVIGVLFDRGWRPAPLSGDDHEVCDCGGESALHHLTSTVLGLVEVAGQSAEPIALDGQFLLIGPPIAAPDALSRLEGRPVIASDGDDNRYFKRLRPTGPSNVALESLEISGDFPPVMLTHSTGASTDLAQVWPVLGVLFDRPH